MKLLTIRITGDTRSTRNGITLPFARRDGRNYSWLGGNGFGLEDVLVLNPDSIFELSDELLSDPSTVTVVPGSEVILTRAIPKRGEGGRLLLDRDAGHLSEEALVHVQAYLGVGEENRYQKAGLSPLEGCLELVRGYGEDGQLWTHPMGMGGGWITCARIWSGLYQMGKGASLAVTMKRDALRILWWTFIEEHVRELEVRYNGASLQAVEPATD